MIFIKIFKYHILDYLTNIFKEIIRNFQMDNNIINVTPDNYETTILVGTRYKEIRWIINGMIFDVFKDCKIIDKCRTPYPKLNSKIVIGGYLISYRYKNNELNINKNTLEWFAAKPDGPILELIP